MKKQTFTLILFLLTNLIQAQNPLVKQWDKRFGGTYRDLFTCFAQTSDGGFILGGWSASSIGGDKTQNTWGGADYWIVKINSLGIKEWDKDFGGIYEDFLYSIKQTTDGGYILGGRSNSGVSGDKSQPIWDPYSIFSYMGDYWIVKLDSLGNKEWDKDFGGTKLDIFSSLQQTTDGGYILGGWSGSDSSGDKTQNNRKDGDYWIVKINSIGIKQWDKRFGGYKGDVLSSLQQTSDNGYILGGYTKSGISGDKSQPAWGEEDYWILKTDSLGNKQWDKDFGGTKGDYLLSIQQTLDGGYIFGGYSYSDSTGDKTQNTWGGLGDTDYWIIKTDSVGIKEWDKDFGGFDDEGLESISQTADKGYLISGSSSSYIGGDKTENNLGGMQSWILKIDSNGIKKWDKTIKTYGADRNSLIVQTMDGCYAIVNQTYAGIGGYKTQPSQGGADYWMVKFCDTTLTTSIAQLSDYPNTFSIYPNPAESILTIALSKSKKITVINLLGETMIEKNLSSAASGKIDLDISFLPSGIYFIKVDNEVKKFVKE